MIGFHYKLYVKCLQYHQTPAHEVAMRARPCYKQLSFSRSAYSRATKQSIHSAHPLHHFYFPPYEGGTKGGL